MAIGSAGGAPPSRSGIAAELAAAGFLDAMEIGRGGGGVVYRCRQESLARNVAIKVMTNDLDEDGQERFLREGYAMGALSGHPNIVNILQVGVTETGRPYIVMPYHAAGSLAERVRREGRIAWPEALRIGVKLCGALETAHRADTLHRDIKPANVLINDYGEPQLSDFGTARIAGGFKTMTGFFTGTLSYTAPEVLAGNPPTVAADVYSLGATLYALIAGMPPHERKTDEDLIAHYLRITSTPVPDLRPQGIPTDVCAAIEKAMAREPTERFVSAEDFGHVLQLAQRHNGLIPDPMALSDHGNSSAQTAAIPATPFTGDHTGYTPPPGSTPPPTRVPGSTPPPGATPAPGSTPPPRPPFGSTPSPSPQPMPAPNRFARTAAVSASSPRWPTPPGHPMAGAPPPPPESPASAPPPPPKKPGRRKILLAAAAAVAVLALVVGSIYFVTSRETPATEAAAPSQPTAEAQAGWQPIANARVARDAVAATEADGTIWIFGGMAADNRVTGRHDGYDPAIDSWKSGDALPVPVQHAMAVTWQGTPVVLGGWRTEGSNTRVATDQVWRVVNSRWVSLPPLSQPRAAGAAAVVGDRIIVVGGVDATGKPLNSTEIFDGASWKPGAPMPTPRQLLAAASDDKLVYAVGGNDGTFDVMTVEVYDPAADSWTSLPPLPQPRSDFGVAIADGRLVAVGGKSGQQVLKSVAALDLSASTWADLPDIGTPRHGLGVAAVGKSVYAIGGSTGPGDGQVTSSAEALRLAARRPQPVTEWRALPNAPTPRLMMAWAVVDDKIWIAGGMRHGETLDTVESYDPKTGEWQQQPSLPVPLHHATAAAYRGQMVVLGGTTENLAEPSNKVFTLRGGKWEELPPLKHARAAPAAAAVGDKLVVVGGQNEKQLVAPTEVFDGKSWSEAADMPTPREHLAAVSDGTYVYAVGGRFLSADENSGAFERFDPASGEWKKLPNMPTPRGSYGAAYVDGRIVAVGGEEPTRVLATVEMYDIATGKWSSVAALNEARHAEVVAAVGNTVYCIGGADRPSHEGPIATVEALDFT